MLSGVTQTTDSAVTERAPRRRTRPLMHRAWIVAAVTFVTIIGGAAFNSLPGLLIDPLNTEFGWSRGEIGLAVSLDMALYGLTAPFAAALMDRFGIRRVVVVALGAVATGALASVWMTASWQLLLYWGLLVGLGTGSMALAFSATVTNRWFVARRGLVTGVLTAAGASGQLVFLPLCAWIVKDHGWRPASVTVALAALVVIPFVWLLMRDHPADVGLAPYGGAYVEKPAPVTGAAKRTVRVLFDAARTGPFWLLAGSFAICGASTNGLIRTYFVPSAHDHGMQITAAASLLAVIGVFDVIGTVFSGWLTDRFDARRLLAVYYALRGVSLLFLPMLMAPTVHPPMVFFIVFYGLDWVATVPPTLALCREQYGEDSAIVFGWVLASHQVGAALVAFLGGVVRDVTGSYDLVWYAAGALCATAALMALVIRRRDTATAVTL
ncbi:MFS transporter [Streptomyces sp. NE06-03E]|uniref:MFS transporter n=1 Tax=Streptomyces silvae TaxID=2803812 RepID=A0ABU8A5G2_9ACTN|nr:MULTISPECIES: MFS transporter [unclassified Streptomyces]WSS63565.1 MFS transporter [Streptomyces sp. NBC_01177]WSS70560.1 MFS transporter [Streptomyces sp. NBC_01175]WSS77564.1 MFS transporter [Streptomyces sp. NBC_01174]MDX3057106.1 MFS transporter [Streptomyces sp. NE06-03E]MDX3327877.1 MFS transporter [Streptomyces sp. ME02-6979-3A]